tara:strand:+ start:6574 stop:7893 length:1320 start_codon:yes stop_codon:yes gene_type:complete
MPSKATEMNNQTINNLINYLVYLVKMTVTNSIEILIVILYIYHIAIYPFVIIGSKLNRRKRKDFATNDLSNNFKFIIFKTGNIGDHLICIDSLKYAQESYNIKNSLIVCKESSIFKDIVEFGNQHDVTFIKYKDFIFKFLINREIDFSKMIIVDTQPLIRLGLIISLLHNNCKAVTFRRSYIDKIFSIFNKNISFEHFNEDEQENEAIIKKLNKGINLYCRNKNIKKEELMNIFEYRNSYIKSPNSYNYQKAIDYHSNKINNLSKNKKPLYIYYGTSGRARHRLPPIEWLESLIKLLQDEYELLLVGGKTELSLQKILDKKLDVKFYFIGKFSLSEWSSIFTSSKHHIPLISFDGGFSHLYGIHLPHIFQIFCSSNANKWKSKSESNEVYECLKGGSPNYKPHLFKVPDKCSFANQGWKDSNPLEVKRKISSWLRGIGY